MLNKKPFILTPFMMFFYIFQKNTIVNYPKENESMLLHFTSFLACSEDRT